MPPRPPSKNGRVEVGEWKWAMGSGGEGKWAEREVGKGKWSGRVEVGEGKWGRREVKWAMGIDQPPKGETISLFPMGPRLNSTRFNSVAIRAQFNPTPAGHGRVYEEAGVGAEAPRMPARRAPCLAHAHAPHACPQAAGSFSGSCSAGRAPTLGRA